MTEVLGEAGIEIDGERYSIPTLDTLTLDEERLLYIYADAVVFDFLPPHPDWDAETVEAHSLAQMEKVRNPEFKRTLAHIAYRRRHAELDDAEIQERIGAVSALRLDLELLRGGGPDPRTSSPNEPDEMSGRFGLASDTGSETPISKLSGSPDSNLANIGIGESDTSSPESLPIASGS